MLIKVSLNWDKSCAGGSWCVECKCRVRKTGKVVIEISETKSRQWSWREKCKGKQLEAHFKFS